MDLVWNRWAVSSVMTRQNQIPTEDGRQVTLALIPLWDMCNHKNGLVRLQLMLTHWHGPVSSPDGVWKQTFLMLLWQIWREARRLLSSAAAAQEFTRKYHSYTSSVNTSRPTRTLN